MELHKRTVNHQLLSYLPMRQPPGSPRDVRRSGYRRKKQDKVVHTPCSQFCTHYHTAGATAALHMHTRCVDAGMYCSRALPHLKCRSSYGIDRPFPATFAMSSGRLRFCFVRRCPGPIRGVRRGRSYWRLRGEDDSLYPPLYLTFEGDKAVHSRRVRPAS